MAQGFKNRPPASTAAGKTRPAGSKRDKKGPKKGARVIKPKRAPAVESHSFKKRLEREQVKRAEEQTAAKMRKPSGEAGLRLVKVPPSSKS